MSEKQIEIGTAVFYECLNPATGFVKRIAKDKSWADVEWNYGVGCRGTTRTPMKRLRPLTQVLNKQMGFL